MPEGQEKNVDVATLQRELSKTFGRPVVVTNIEYNVYNRGEIYIKFMVTAIEDNPKKGE